MYVAPAETELLINADDANIVNKGSPIIHMKKLLDSDWLRAVQFKCNASANYTL